jgi:hypothetical protein
MKNRRSISTLALGSTLAALASVPAPASPLLSGYGGPGQGNQAILGSTLLNRPGGGGPGGDSSGGTGGDGRVTGGGGQVAGTGSPTTVSGAATAPDAGTRGGGTSVGSASGRDGRSSGGSSGGPGSSHGSGESASKSAAPTYPTPANEAQPASAESALELSSTDLLLILLALGALALTGVFTMRLTRTTPSGTTPRSLGGPQRLKGRAAEPE